MMIFKVYFGDWNENSVDLYNVKKFDKDMIEKDVIKMGKVNYDDEEEFTDKDLEEMDVRNVGSIGFDVYCENVSEFGWLYLSLEEMGDKIWDIRNGCVVEEVSEDLKWVCVGEYDEEDEYVLVEYKDKDIEYMRVVKSGDIENWSYKIK